MSYYRDESDAYTDDDANERDEHACNLAQDYLAAREAVDRLRPGQDRDVVWRAKNRLYLAEIALTAKREAVAYGPMHAQIVREIRGAA